MAEPELIFGFNHDSQNDTPWGFMGGYGDNTNVNGWMGIDPLNDLIVFTGGGILGTLPVPSCPRESRDATIRPSVTSYYIPQVYVEKEDQMYIAQNTGHYPRRYAMGVYINGHMTSDLYLEAWDDHTFTTTSLEVLSGTPNSGFNSYINAIRTTDVEPPWHPGWGGIDDGAAFLRGTESRVRLNNTSSITNKAVYYNIYIKLETDCSTFRVFPVLSFRYLYT
jgi:hypothetical protein